MGERPTAVELLEAVCATLAEEVLPQVPHELRYSLRMAANAIGIALRDLVGGEEADRQEAASAAALYGETMTEEAGASAAELVQRLNRRLAGEIRAGRFDPPDREAALRRHLMRAASARTAIGNPKALKE
jgi:hypothetical protein